MLSEEVRTATTDAYWEPYYRFEEMLQQLADGRGTSMSFAKLYNHAYKMCMRKRAAAVREIAEKQLRRLSLARPWPLFRERYLEICDVALYEENTYAFINGLVPLKEYANCLYGRPVARWWRLLRVYALWARRVAAWRMAFDQVRFMPGGSAVGALEDEFYGLAE